MDSETAVRPCSVQQCCRLRGGVQCAMAGSRGVHPHRQSAVRHQTERTCGGLQHCSSPGSVSSAIVSLSCSLVLLQLNFSLLSDCLNFQFRIASSITVRNQPFQFILKRLVLFVFCPARESESIQSIANSWYTWKKFDTLSAVWCLADQYQCLPSGGPTAVYSSAAAV